MNEQIFIPRYYECDPYDHVNHAFYVRYAIEAISGLLARKATVSKVAIEFIRPATYHKPLKLQTQKIAESEELVVFESNFFDEGSLEAAKAKIGLIYSGGKLSAIEGMPVPRTPWKTPPPGAYQTRRRVRWYQLNPAGHLDSAWYLSLFEDVVLEAAVSAGWSMEKAQQHGIGFFARSAFLELDRPMLLDQEFNVTTYIAEIGNTSVLRENRMQINDEVVARAQIWWVFVDLATGRPGRLPGAWMQDFADQICIPEN